MRISILVVGMLLVGCGGNAPDTSAGGPGTPCPAGCDDGNPCTDDVCEAKGCLHYDNTASCGDACNPNATCSIGVCVAGRGFCEDDNVCTKDVCTLSNSGVPTCKNEATRNPCPAGVCYTASCSNNICQVACVACGGIGQPCCSGPGLACVTEAACRPDWKKANTACKACGGSGETTCEGTPCKVGVPTDGICP